MSNTQDLALFGSDLTVGEDITLSKNVVTPEFNVSAFTKSLSDTAVDVFVYDTSKDSDGGAWRNRTQDASWYNETLNTATRGSRKEFPSVAVIVAETDTVTIYDGDDPDLPMWMVFISDAWTFLAPNTRTTTSVKMLNGILCIGRRDSAGFLSYISFVDDSAKVYSSAPSEYRDWLKPIADRNTTEQLLATNTAYDIIDDNINDVAMTVLPSAPIDSATGLPIPTIAVATDGGVSVIKDDGTIVDITVNNVNYTFARRVNFLSDNSLGMGIGVENGVAQESYYIFNSIPSSDNVITVDGITGTTKDVDEFYAIQSSNAVVDLQLLGLDSNRALLSSTGNSFASNEGLSVVDRNVVAPDKGLISYIASNYNTGWMPGDIKLATLSQKYTDGLDLVTNGHFDTDTSGWTAVGGAVLSLTSTDEGNRLRLESNGPASPYAYQQISTVIGETYTVTYDGYYDTVNYKLSVGTTQGGTELTDSPGGLAVDSHTTLTFFATSTTTYLSLYLLGAGEFSYAEFDNISVSLASEIYGAELVTNGTFDTDTSGWTANTTSGSGTTFSQNNQTLEIVRGLLGLNNGEPYQILTTKVGKVYALSFDITGATMSLIVGTELGLNDLATGNKVPGSYNISFTATTTTTYISFIPDVATTTSNVDNVSVRLAEEDRSVNNNGLQRFDTIQKVPLLPGSDLVSFNFDQGYLIQPHNSDLNFGTGDFSIIGWAKLNEDTTYANLVIRDEGTGNNQFGVFVRGPSGVGGQENCLGFYLTDSGGSSLQTNPPNVIQVGQWFQYCVVRTGTDVKIYINSKLVGTTTMATDHTSTSAVLAIGASTATSNQSTDIEQALLRISSTGPTTEQIAKMYDAEKFLFQENAKATLYGTSDAVTALAYDDTTRLLHVGTSSGRSVFQGLRRVDNTTTAVVSTISASNSLIAED